MQNILLNVLLFTDYHEISNGYQSFKNIESLFTIITNKRYLEYLNQFYQVLLYLVK